MTIDHRRSSRHRFALGAAMFAVVAVPATAQDNAIAIRLPAQPLARSLEALGRQSGSDILFTPDAVAGGMAPAIDGRMDVATALERLVAGRGLEIRRQPDGAFLVSRAQASAAPAAPEDADIVITGYRASLAKARQVKRDATIIQDSIVAEDIGAFPDLNLAEALQRLPGIAINREAGEGRRVSLRGLGPDFTRVQLNGMEVLGNVDSPQDSRGQTTRDRAFDFNIFAAELFSRVDARKSFSAEQTEGGLAGTVGLYTARPFDYAEDKAAFSVQAGTNTLTRDFQPRLTGLVSKQWGDFGILVSGAYSHRQTQEQGYDTYRWRLNRANGSDISALSAADQAKINSGTLYFPRGNRLSVWESEQDRLGLTGSAQWRPSDKAQITFDALYGIYKADRFETHLAARGAGGSTWLGGGATFAGVTYRNSKVNEIRYNDRNEVTYLDVSGANTASETRIQETKNVFKQFVLSGDVEIADGLKVTTMAGIERSSYDVPVSDKFYLETYGDVISDYGDDAYSLTNSYGYDTADASRWHAREIDMSATYQDSAFDNARGKLAWEVASGDTVSVGGEWRRFKNSGYSQTNDDVLLSQFRAGTVSSDVSGYAKTYTGYDGQDWTIVDYDEALAQLGVTRTLGARQNVYAVEERTANAFLQYDWKHDLGSVPFRGNVGARHYRTDTLSTGITNAGDVAVRARYDGVLPAANLIFEVWENLLLRTSAARNINRPTLSALSVNGTVSNTDGEISVSVGNPQLKPYKSTDLDFSAEYYLGKNRFVAAAIFYKQIDGFIGTQTLTDVPFSETGLPTSVLRGVTNDTIVATFSRPINFAATDLFGAELSAQSDFDFLPAPFDRLGTTFNVTYADSKLDYATPDERATGKSYVSTLEGLSRITANATLYYQDGKFDARVSGNYRSGYVYSARPIGTDQDSSGYDDTLYLDMAAHYKLTAGIELTLDAVNLTNQREKQYTNSSRRLYVVTRSGTTVLGGVRVQF